MRVMKCNQPTYFDVDDTLVMWGRGHAGEPGVVAITCPPGRHARAASDLGFEPDEIVSTGEWTEYLVPHKGNIEAMKRHKLRGHTIIVWSAGGWEWAHAVVVALELEQFVDLVLEKPRWAYDDLPPNEYMPKSQWVKEEDDAK